MTAPSIPTRAADHPRFSGEGEEQPRKKIDTSAARDRVTASRTAAKASDKPPSRRATQKKDDTPKPDIPYTAGMFKAPVAMVYGQVGNMVSFVAYPIGVSLVEQAGPCAEAWDKVAKQNPAVRRWLLNLTKTGAWGELFAAHLPVLMATMMVFGPQSFRDRMAGAIVDSVQQHGADTTDQDH